MVHFDLGNIIVLSYGVKSCRRFLKKLKTVEAFETSPLIFFAKAYNATTAESPPLFQQLKKELFHSDPPLVNANAPDYLDSKWWIKQY